MAVIALFAIGAGTTAYAAGYGAGGGMGPGAGMGMGGAMQGTGNRLPADFQPKTKDEADKIAADYLASNMKGYSVVESGTFEGKRFTGYTYTVQDASGNKFNIIVNARGDVRGPFTPQK
jgi:hypothetical protein